MLDVLKEYQIWKWRDQVWEDVTWNTDQQEKVYFIGIYSLMHVYDCMKWDRTFLVN